MNTLENVFRILDENKVEYKKIEHEPVRTSEEAAKIRGVPLKTGVKALLLKTKERFIMVLVPADRRVDIEKIEELEKSKKVRLATSQEVLEETGCDVGGVPPFGHTKGGVHNQIKTYLDKEVFQSELANFNAGDRGVSVSMKAEDLKKVVYYILF